jgi:hypothetical protein
MTDTNIIEGPFEAQANKPILNNAVLTLDLKPIKMGDTTITWNNSLFASGLMSAVAQQCARDAAAELFFLRTSLFADEEVVEGTCPSLNEVFEGDHLKPEYASERTDAQVNHLELRYAQYLGIAEVALDLDHAWREFYSESKARRNTAPQYALRPNPRFIEGRSAEPRFEPVLSFEDAVIHYFETNSRFKSLKTRVEARKKQVERVSTLSSMSTEERRKALNF